MIQKHHVTTSPQKNSTAPMQYGALPVTGFVRLADLRPILPFSDSTLWRRVKNQTFPSPIRISERVTAWRAEDVRLWLDEQGKRAAVAPAAYGFTVSEGVA